MECLIPPCLIVIREVRWHMENNVSVRESIKLLTQSHHGELIDELRSWFLRQQNGIKPTSAQKKLKSPFQNALISLLERGLLGQPILESLKILEDEVHRAAVVELDYHIGRLPFLSMIPLFLFQFPAYLILLLGPLMSSLLHEMSSQ
jgi:hypothetical protein